MIYETTKSEQLSDIGGRKRYEYKDKNYYLYTIFEESLR